MRRDAKIFARGDVLYLHRLFVEPRTPPVQSNRVTVLPGSASDLKLGEAVMAVLSQDLQDEQAVPKVREGYRALLDAGGASSWTAFAKAAKMATVWQEADHMTIVGTDRSRGGTFSYHSDAVELDSPRPKAVGAAVREGLRRSTPTG